ncbi:uncharacterized protein LOC111249861 [Varroa destructor]|uniref:C2H2-type domain-containing protein n=1 Tax=Varroa destructor TaxID=109461 RepID=A0A7M7K3Q7_VARDE|nr:uncharacterized protein LOC111249861 [Varroa destructor]
MYSSGCQLYSLGDEAFSPATGPGCGESDNVELPGFLFGSSAPNNCVPPPDALVAASASTVTVTPRLTTTPSSAMAVDAQAAVAAAGRNHPADAHLSQSLVGTTAAPAIVQHSPAIISSASAIFAGASGQHQLDTTGTHNPSSTIAAATTVATARLQQIQHVTNEPQKATGSMTASGVADRTETTQLEHQHRHQQHQIHHQTQHPPHDHQLHHHRAHFVQQSRTTHHQQQLQQITPALPLSSKKDPVKLLTGSRTKRYSGPLPYRPRRTKVDKSDHHCKICDKYYSNRKQLRKHVNSFHPEEPFEMTSKNLNLDRVNWCLEKGCDFRHDRNHIFTKHLEEKHRIVAERIDRKFNTFAEYERWKTEIEESQKIKFVAGDGYYWRLTKDGRRVSRQHLFCHKAKEFNTVGKKVTLRMEGHTEDEIERLVKPTWNKITESLAKETQAKKNLLAHRNNSVAVNGADDNSSEKEENIEVAVDEMEVIRRLVPGKQNLIKTARTNSKGGCFLFSQCTAYLHVTIFEHDRSVHVDGCLSHYGHDPVLEHDIFDLPESVVSKIKQRFVMGHSLEEVRCFAANQWPHFCLKDGALEGIRDRNLRRILFKQYYAPFTNIFERVVDISRTINQFYYVEPEGILVTLLNIEHTLHDLHKQLVKKVNEKVYPKYKPEKVFRDSPVDIQQVLETLSMQQNFSHFKRLVRYSEHHKAFYMNHKITKDNLQCVSEFDMALADDGYRCFELDEDNKRSGDEQIRRKRRDLSVGEDDSSNSLEKAPFQTRIVSKDAGPDESIEDLTMSSQITASVPAPLCSTAGPSIIELNPTLNVSLPNFNTAIDQDRTNRHSGTLSTDVIQDQSHYHQRDHRQVYDHHLHPQQRHQSCEIHFMDTSVPVSALPSFSTSTTSNSTAAEHDTKKSSFNEFLQRAAEATHHGEDQKQGHAPTQQKEQQRGIISDTQCLHNHQVSFSAEDESLTLSHLPEFLPKSPIEVGNAAKADISLAVSSAVQLATSVPTGGDSANATAAAHISTVDLSTYLTLGAPFGAPDSDNEAGNEGDLMLSFDHLFGLRTPQS